MDKLRSKKWWSDVLIRDLKTAASVALGTIGACTTLGAVNWLLVLDTVALSVIVNTLVNIAMLPDPEEKTEE